MARQVIPFNVEEARKSQAIGRIVATLPFFSVEFLSRLADRLQESPLSDQHQTQFSHARLMIRDDGQTQTQHIDTAFRRRQLRKTP